MKFTKLKIEEKLSDTHNRYSVPRCSRVTFGSRNIIVNNFTTKQIRNVFEFSYYQASKLNQKEGWHDSDENEQRKSYEMFVDTFNGKIGEEGVVDYFSNVLKIPNSGVDYKITGKNEGDITDIDIINNNKILKVSVRTTKHFANLLLLETSKSFDQYDAFIMARLKTIMASRDSNYLGTLIPRALRTNEFNEEHRKDLYEFISSNLKFELEIVGKMLRDDFVQLRKTSNFLRRGDYMGSTKIKTENLYVCSGDLKALRRLK